MKSRSVYWFLFPLLAIVFISMRLWNHCADRDWIQTTLINISFVIVQLVILSIYFSIKNRRWVNISTGLLGIGDILFLLCITLYLSTLNFLFFYIISLIMVLICWLVWQLIISRKDKSIPLAGLQAFLFSLFLMADWWIKHFNLTDDSWLLNLIKK